MQNFCNDFQSLILKTPYLFHVGTLHSKKQLDTLACRFHALLTDTHFPVRAKPISRVTDTFEWTINIHTFAISTHSCLRTFIKVHTECPIQWWCKAFLAHTSIGSRYVFTATLQADSCILITFIDIWIIKKYLLLEFFISAMPVTSSSFWAKYMILQ